jgi:hypothetical protein
LLIENLFNPRCPDNTFLSDRKKDGQQRQGTKNKKMKAKVSLGLAKMPVPRKIEKARHIVKEMGADARFANSIPALAEVTTATNELEIADNEAQGAGPAQTAVMHQKEEVLDSLLTRLGNFVEIIANGDEAVILAAGMDVKDKATRQAFQFSVANGEHEGEAVLQSPATPRASYVWQRSIDPVPTEPPAPANTSKWEQIAVTTVATLTTNSLMAGTKYWFRVATVTLAGQGLWSDPISLIAQ